MFLHTRGCYWCTDWPMTFFFQFSPDICWTNTEYFKSISWGVSELLPLNRKILAISHLHVHKLANFSDFPKTIHLIEFWFYNFPTYHIFKGWKTLSVLCAASPRDVATDYIRHWNLQQWASHALLRSLKHHVESPGVVQCQFFFHFWKHNFYFLWKYRVARKNGPLWQIISFQTFR